MLFCAFLCKKEDKAEKSTGQTKEKDGSEQDKCGGNGILGWVRSNVSALQQVIHWVTVFCSRNYAKSWDY